MFKEIKDSFLLLEEYCRREEFKGYDPYDGLNSRFFQALPVISTNRLARLIWIQVFKRSPWNFRALTGVKKDYNPKALGLFLSGYCNLSRMEPEKDYSDQISFFSEKLFSLVNKGRSGACWGYNFDWQSRAFFQPKYSPTVVTTSFISMALLDAYEITGETPLLRTARSACDFILKDLNRTCDDQGDFAFSYSPSDKSVVFNASLLGSRLLARVYSYTGEEELIEEARRSVLFCCKHQRTDGSWAYGTLPFHQWTDSFHTGYNLECLADFIRFTGDRSAEENLEKGFNYYIRTFFTEEGIPKYYNNSVYPVDIHAPAQLIITLAKTNKFKEHQAVADRVFKWVIDHMQSDEGYFYYQINRYFLSKISYMRWSQAWMFYALSTYLLLEKAKVNDTEAQLKSAI